MLTGAMPCSLRLLTLKWMMWSSAARPAFEFPDTRSQLTSGFCTTALTSFKILVSHIRLLNDTFIFLIIEKSSEEYNFLFEPFNLILAGTGTDQNLVVATSRPETMFGDVAVAVHPDDSKYQALIGKKVLHPVNGKSIPVIADSRVKMNFGTGYTQYFLSHEFLPNA